MYKNTAFYNNKDSQKSPFTLIQPIKLLKLFFETFFFDTNITVQLYFSRKNWLEM